MTDHDDTEALAIILDKCQLSGQECRSPLTRYSELTDDRNTHWHRRIAERGDSMVPLAAYVARKVEGVERARDEARAVIERVTALVGEWAAGGAASNPFPEGVVLDVVPEIIEPLRAALAPATEPALDRPLTDAEEA